MTNNQLPLDPTFQALADPTRRRVIERLSLGPATVSELAEPFDMALPSFLQHLKVLEQGGLVQSEKVGRVRTYRLVPERIRYAGSWLGDQLRVWERRLDQLDGFLHQLSEEMHHDESN